MKLKTLILTAVGVSAIVFAVVWLVAVFPNLKRIPADYDQTVDFQGSFRFVINQEFLMELFTDPVLVQIFSRPQSLALLSQPTTQQLLASDEARTLLADPDLIQKAIADPESVIQQGLGAVVELLGNPSVLQLLSDPAIQVLVNDPAALQLMLNPITAELIASGGQPKLVSLPVDFHRVRTSNRTEGDILFLDQTFSASMRGSGSPLPQFSSTSLLA